jgi:hypothetical protein
LGVTVTPRLFLSYEKGAYRDSKTQESTLCLPL